MDNMTIKARMEEIAREMYYSHGEVTGHRNFQGDAMPAWSGLGETIQAAWIAAATTAYHLSRGTE